MSRPHPRRPAGAARARTRADLAALAAQVRDYLRFVLRAPRRRPGRALAAVLLMTALGAAAYLTFPLRWEVRASVLASAGPLLGALAAPAHGNDAPERAVREVLTRRDVAVAICKQVRFPERHLATRAPAVRLRDEALRLLTGRRRQAEDLLEPLADSIQDRLQVQAAPSGAIEISFQWADRELAFDVVEAAVKRFMEDRYATDQRMLEEALAILEQHDAEVQQELAATIKRLAAREQELRRQGGAALAPTLLASTSRDEDLARLEVALGMRRRAMADVEAFRAARAADLRDQLERHLATYAPDHPTVASTRQALASLGAPSAQAQALRAEVHDLERAVVARGGRLDGNARTLAAFQGSFDLVDRLRLEWRDPQLGAERSRLEGLLREHARMLEQKAAARSRMDAAPLAFKYSYSVVTPPQRPRQHARPYALLFLGGGLAGGLALALFLAVAAEVAAGGMVERWRAEQEPALQTSAGGQGAAGRAGAPLRPGAVALLLGVAAATAAAVLAGGGPVLAVAPSLGAAAAWLATRVPLRWSVAVLLFGLLGVDDLAENVGQWRTPLAVVGSLLQERLDAVTNIPGLAVCGLEVVAVFLLAVWAQRRAMRATVDGDDRIPTPTVLRGLLLATLAAVALAEVVGLLHGQSLAPWKVRNLLHPVLLVLLFDAAFRGPVDLRLIGRVVVAAAVTRAVLAVVVQRLAVAQTGGKFATATSHGDSVLFASAAFLLVLQLGDRASLRRLLRAGLLLPILLLGMIENGRRLVWVMLGAMLLVAYLVAPMRGWKRRLTRIALVAAPLAALYVAVGWESDARVFAPVKTLRGVTDTSYDHSAYWREVENWNIAMSMRERPILGLGLGGRYTEHMFNDDISSLYREYREWPHNTVLGQLLLLGLLGFTAVWSFFAGGLFLAFRAYRLAADPDLRVAALACAGALVACLMMAYGDTGAHYTQFKVAAALAVAVAAKLAVATGAWPRPGEPG